MLTPRNHNLEQYSRELLCSTLCLGCFLQHCIAIGLFLLISQQTASPLQDWVLIVFVENNALVLPSVVVVRLEELASCGLYLPGRS
jgi:hypothetical protein